MAVLADSGATLQKPPAKGPDILIKTPSGGRVWIEAVVPGPGNGPDKVWQRPPGHSGPFSGPKEEGVMLRYLSAIQAKRLKVNSYRSEGIVGDDDACLVAVSQGGILDADLLDVDAPTMARAVLGIGKTVMVVPIYSDEPSHTEVRPQHEVSKASGAPVSTTRFLDGEADALAGVLFASDAVWNLTWEAARSLRLLHNPTARVPVARGSIPACCEMWVEDETLRHRGRCARHGHYASAGTAFTVDA